MRTETFFKKFDQLAGAPNAVDKMRELVLRLAMGGKLVEQNSNESSGAEVFAAIQQFRTKQFKSRKVTTSPNWVIAGDDIQLPGAWWRCAIEEVCDLKTGATPSTREPRYFGGTIRWLVSGDINQGEIFECDGRISELGIANSNCKIVPKDSVLIALNGQGKTRATVALLRVEATLNQSLVAMIPYSREHLIPEFLFWNLRGRYRAIRDVTGQDQRRGLNMKVVGQLSLPIPPVEEQRRIVARIRELMRYCDELEEQQKERDSRHSVLTHATVTRFNETPTLANLNFLFHGSYSVPPLGLRESILSVAIRGKLGPQNSNDEPAASLVETIAEFRSRWLDGERDKSLKRVREIDNKKCSHDIPASWTWCRLGDIVLEFRYGTSRKCSRVQHGVPVLRIPNIQAGRVDASDLKFTSMPSSEFAELQLQRGDLLVVRSNGSEKLVGRSAVVSPADEQFAYAGYLVRLRIPQEFICSRYLQLALSSSGVRSQIEGPIRTTSGVKNINTTELSNLVFPLAPFAEQRRIVDRIDRLMPLVDKLEAHLAASKGISTKLLDAAVYEILHSEDGLIEPSKMDQDITANRLAIGSYVINQLTRNPNFGRTMLMKVFYLSETHVGLPQGWQPMRQAAGPYDPCIEDFESIGIQRGWFTLKKKTLSNGHEMVQYEGKSGLEVQIAKATSVLGGQKAEFDRLLDFFQNKTTEEAEIIATLFAAWNDLLIDGKSPSDDEIIREVRENWHYKKERFTPTLLTRWLNWLRQQSVIPRGLAPRTRQQLKLGLS